jgi:hypothetical protein
MSLRQALGLVILLLSTQVTTYSSHIFLQQPDEADSYKAFYEANAAKDLPKAYELAKKHLKDFPTGKYAEYFKTKYIPNTRAILFNQAVAAKNSDAMISLSNEVFAETPDDLNYLLPLAQHFNLNEVNAKPPITTHAKEAEDYTRRAVKLLEAGKRPADTSFKANEVLKYFYQVLAATEERNKNTDAALALFEKAAALDGTDSFTFLHTGAIYQQKYIKAADKYQALPEADKTAATPSEQTLAIRKELNDAADAMLDRWIKFLKLTATTNPYGKTRAEIEETVSGVYKYRHPESPEGYRELIKP